MRGSPLPLLPQRETESISKQLDPNAMDMKVDSQKETTLHHHKGRDIPLIMKKNSVLSLNRNQNTTLHPKAYENSNMTDCTQGSCRHRRLAFMEQDQNTRDTCITVNVTMVGE